ncbi:MAG: hypothetical protein KC613_06250 [Myxococcales bacterium]|nr:hypothetical protein [Myxococcales bacterium]
MARALPDAVQVHVPRQLDQTERVLLTLGTALGTEAVEAVDDGLRTAPDDTAAILTELDRHLGDRPVLIDDWTALGDLGADRELSTALRDRAHLVRTWLADRPGVFLGRRAGVPALSDAPPVQLVNGQVQDTQALWTDCNHDPIAYQLALSSHALEGAAPELGSLDDLRSRILDELPEGTHRLLTLLAVHGRPLPRHLVEGVAEIAGDEVSLWTQVGGSLWVEPGWVEYVQRTRTPKRLIELHQDLAARFRQDVQPDAPNVAQRGLSILEAHRHMIAAGDTDGARTFWRYGAALLVEAARSLSLDGDYSAAAQLYGAVVHAADADRLSLPQRLAAYTRHYLHYNRAHGGLEGLPQTEQGYQRALADWRENALFWSRLVRVHCLSGQFGRARAALVEAQRDVPEHPEKQAVLVARTVKGLLQRGRQPEHHRLLLDAVRIWGEYQPRSLKARAVEAELARVLERGWQTTQIVLDDAMPLYFHRPTQVTVRRLREQWLAELPGLDAVLLARGPSPEAALFELVRTTRATVQTLMQAHTADLSPQQRMHKRLLLGRVDVIASRLGGERRDHYWYLGRLEHEDDGYWLCTYGATALRFKVPDSKVQVLDDRDYLARVRTDADGVPVGPVDELEVACALSDDELWRAWQARMADGN